MTSDAIGRITTDGAVSVYTDPSLRGPYGITAGLGGSLWFTNGLGDSLGKIITAGVIFNYRGTGVSVPEGITKGPDGAMWFANEGNNSIGRESSGVISNYTGTGIDAPLEIVTGPDGAMWFTNGLNNSIGRITTPAFAAVSPPSGVPGQSVTVSGGGFTPSEAVKVTYKTGLASPRSVVLCTATAASGGAFSCNGNIPVGSDAGALGAHKIVAKGFTSLSKARAIYTVM